MLTSVYSTWLDIVVFDCTTLNFKIEIFFFFIQTENNYIKWPSNTKWNPPLSLSETEIEDITFASAPFADFCCFCLAYRKGSTVVVVHVAQ